MNKLLNVTAGLAFLVAIAVLARPQDLPKPPSYTPSETQKLKLELKHKDAEIANILLRDAQARYQTAIAALQNEGTVVIKENKWPDDLLFDAESLTFTTKPPAAKQAPKPEKQSK